MGWGGGYLWCSFNELQLIPVTSKPLSEMRDRDTWFTPTTVQCSSRPQLAPCFFFGAVGVCLQSFTLLHWCAFKFWELFCMCVQQRVRGYGIKEWHYLLCISLLQKYGCVCVYVFVRERGDESGFKHCAALSHCTTTFTNKHCDLLSLYCQRNWQNLILK